MWTKIFHGGFWGLRKRITGANDKGPGFQDIPEALRRYLTVDVRESD